MCASMMTKQVLVESSIPLHDESGKAHIIHDGKQVKRSSESASYTLRESHSVLLPWLINMVKY